MRHAEELQFSVYNFERADISDLWNHFNAYEKECLDLLERFKLIRTAAKDQQYQMIVIRFPLLAAYDLCLKCSHLFNLLDARGAISVTERVAAIARVRQLAVGIANAYLHQQEVVTGQWQKKGIVNA